MGNRRLEHNLNNRRIFLAKVKVHIGKKSVSILYMYIRTISGDIQKTTTSRLVFNGKHLDSTVSFIWYICHVVQFFDMINNRKRLFVPHLFQFYHLTSHARWPNFNRSWNSVCLLVKVLYINSKSRVLCSLIYTLLKKYWLFPAIYSNRKKKGVETVVSLGCFHRYGISVY